MYKINSGTKLSKLKVNFLKIFNKVIELKLNYKLNNNNNKLINNKIIILTITLIINTFKKNIFVRI